MRNKQVEGNAGAAVSRAVAKTNVISGFEAQKVPPRR
jgi:hypothetical protein